MHLTFTLLCGLSLSTAFTSFVVAPVRFRSLTHQGPLSLVLQAAPKKKVVDEGPKVAKRYPVRPAAGRMTALRKTLKTLTRDNFSDIYSFEELLTKEVGPNFLRKSMAKINRVAKYSGVELKAGFASDPVATKVRRDKQDAFVKAKIAAVAEEEASAAEAVEEPVVEESAEEPVAEATEEPVPA